MKIYTKTGDKGETGVIGGRVSKASSVIETVGTLDEVNSAIGVVITKMSNDDPSSSSGRMANEVKNSTLGIRNSTLGGIQNTLFSIGAYIAGGKTTSNFKLLTSNLEKEIDQMEKELPPLQNFILPGGSEASSFIHLARSICRRAERQYVKYLDEAEAIPSLGGGLGRGREAEQQAILKYLNRLSDYLFVLARFVNKESGVGDVIWEKNS